jgi:RNA polymerase sigma-70 factor (ECF subfamily)
MHTTSVTLLEALRSSTAQDAWRRFVQLYSPLLLRWARQLGLQDSDAADLVQDVFVTLVAKLPGFRYDRDGSFRRWLHTVLRNRWRDWQRRKTARPVSTGNSTLIEMIPDDDESAADLSEVEYHKQLLNRALQLLRDEFQPITWRAFWEHGVAARPAADVARELGLTPGAVYAAKFRVMTRLRKELNGLVEL